VVLIRLLVFPVLLVLSVIFLVACSGTYRAYKGSKKPPDLIAVVIAGDTKPRERERGWDNWSSEMPAALMWTYGYVEIWKVDNKIVPQSKRKRAELLPGHRCIGISFRREYIFIRDVWREETGHYELCFDADPEHTYIANHAYSEETDIDYMWIIDQVDGRQVAGKWSPPDGSNSSIKSSD
jgi:hypothetical protein